MYWSGPIGPFWSENYTRPRKIHYMFSTKQCDLSVQGMGGTNSSGKEGKLG